MIYGEDEPEEQTVHKKVDLPPELQRELFPSRRPPPKPKQPAWWERFCTPSIMISPFEIVVCAGLLLSASVAILAAILWVLGGRS